MLKVIDTRKKFLNALSEGLNISAVELTLKDVALEYRVFKNEHSEVRNAWANEYCKKLRDVIGFSACFFIKRGRWNDAFCFVSSMTGDGYAVILDKLPEILISEEYVNKFRVKEKQSTN